MFERSQLELRRSENRPTRKPVASLYRLLVATSILGLVVITTPNSLQATQDPDELAAIEPLEPIAPFELSSWSGKSITWPSPEEAELLVIAFIGTECPLVKLYIPKLNKLQSEFGDGQLQIIAVDSNSQDSLLEMSAFARRNELKFPFVKDPGNQVADRFMAERTPEIFVLDAERKLRYRGRIDDQYGVGYGRSAAMATPFQDAIQALLAGRDVPVLRTEPVGCLIGRAVSPNEDAQVTYSKHISRIFQSHCIECHRAGEIGPFSLEDYEDASGWSEMVEEVIREGRMPPWNADPSIGEFANSRVMTESEKEQVYQWVADGSPLGDVAHQPEPPTYVEGWQLPREPDVVIEMSTKAFQVPAEGVVEYQYFIVDPGFTEDKWVNVAQVVPGDSSVVHHAIVFYRAPEAQGDDHLGWITGYVPGQRIAALEDGQARRIPAGSRLIFQMHYTPNGRPAEDVTRIGLCFVPADSVKREVLTVPSLERDFEIPPNHSDYIVETSLRGFPKGSTLLGVAPHMHYRGRSFELAVSQSATENAERIISVPKYDFNWQHSYRLAEPLELQPETEFRCINHFDNSDRNLSNPDPTIPVRWGDQTWEEMAVTFFEVALPEGQTAEELALRRSKANVDRNKEAIAMAERYMQRFDKNRDGQLKRSEVPESFAAFAFHRYDEDGDQTITEGEIVKYILRDE